MPDAPPRHIRRSLLVLIPLALTACGGAEDAPGSPPDTANAATPTAPGAASPAPSRPAVLRWDLQSNGEGTALALLSGSGNTTLRLLCDAGRNRLRVNVPAFRPVGSEDRLSFGGGGEVVALVADPRGDAQRGGVTGTGPAPFNLLALLGGPVSAHYGAQNTGPHPAPPREQARAFAAACGKPAGGRDTPPPPAAPVSPCNMQGEERLNVRPLRALGTEPFWSARIEGRCVTYAHPEDQAGTRIWTRYAPTSGGGTWTGALNGKPFTLRTRAQPNCSDGMSDKVYPIAVELTLGGERRTGCAGPL
jgi:uncharacterized membrane protein